jgi:hypothetical protein
MITIIALVLQAFMSLVTPGNSDVVVIPPMPQDAPHITVIDADDYGWAEYYTEAYDEYADEFTALFNSYEIKRAKDGRLMIRRGNSGSFKFAKKG